MHESLRLRAKRSRISMREYVLRLIEADVGRQDTWEQTLQRLRRGPQVSPEAPSAAELIREAREERDRQLMDVVLKRK